MNVAILLSGGKGTRIGREIPKQYIEVNGTPIFTYSLRCLLNNDKTDTIIIVVDKEWIEFAKREVERIKVEKPVFYCEAGESRQLSVFNAFLFMKKQGFSDSDIVLIHEAARPLASQSLFDRCYCECECYDAVVPVIPVKDTVYYSENGKCISFLLNRNFLWRGQAPEAFRFGKYFNAMKACGEAKLRTMTGGMELAYNIGLNCSMVEGEILNFKITTPEDLSNFECIINSRNREE